MLAGGAVTDGIAAGLVREDAGVVEEAATEAEQRAAGAQAYLRDMYYAVSSLPQGGLQEGKLYSVDVLGKSITYWRGASSLPPTGVTSAPQARTK